MTFHLYLLFLCTLPNLSYTYQNIGRPGPTREYYPVITRRQFSTAAATSSTLLQNVTSTAAVYGTYHGVFAFDVGSITSATCTPCSTSPISSSASLTTGAYCTPDAYSGVFRPDPNVTTSTNTQYCYGSSYSGPFQPSTSSTLPCCETNVCSVSSSSLGSYTGVFRPTTTTVSSSSTASISTSFAIPGSSLTTSSVSSTSTSKSTAAPSSTSASSSMSSVSSGSSSGRSSASSRTVSTSSTTPSLSSIALSSQSGTISSTVTAATSLSITSTSRGLSSSLSTFTTSVSGSTSVAGTATTAGSVSGSTTLTLPLSTSGSSTSGSFSISQSPRSGTASTTTSTATPLSVSTTTTSSSPSSSITSQSHPSGATPTPTPTHPPSLTIPGILILITTITHPNPTAPYPSITTSNSFLSTILTISANHTISIISVLATCPTAFPRYYSNDTSIRMGRFANATTSYSNSTIANSTLPQWFCNVCVNDKAICCPPGVACGADGHCPWLAVQRAGFVCEGRKVAV